MTKLLLPLFIAFSSLALAQVSTIKIEKEKPPVVKPPNTSIGSIDLHYGYLAYQDDFYKQLNTGENLNFELPPQIVGIGVSGLQVLVGRSYILFQMDGQKYLPQFITIHDTIQATYSGARFGMGLGKRFRNASGNLSLACYLGFNSGRSTLKNSDFIAVQKPFFCPKISIQPKVIVRNVAISLTITAQGDVTGLRWFPSYVNGYKKVPLANMSQTGISALLGIGYRL